MKLILSSLLIATYTLLNYTLIAQENDIVINEIMADPSPVIALPEQEYIELYNTSSEAININKWKIIIGKKELLFDDDIVIQSDGYLILCHNDAIEELSPYGNCHGFSSFQITNSGSNVSLIDKNDRLISAVDFDISWHSATYKKDGGWSLEQIDAFNPCAGKKNWGSSSDKNGGSPGKINSIAGENVIPPKLDHIIASSHNEIEVFFNQNMDFESLQKTDNYIITELNIPTSSTSAAKTGRRKGKTRNEQFCHLLGRRRRIFV